MAAPAPAIPLFERLLIESQSNCNRACWFCPRTYDRSGRYLDSNGAAVLHRMPTETILDLLDQAQRLDFHGWVGFHHFSEPLLDDRNLLLAAEARRRGMRPQLHTNGDVLRRDAALCREVTRLYELIVVGLYDYATNEELAEAKRYWTERLAGAARLAFSPIGIAGARSAHSVGIPKALVPSDPRMAIPDLRFAQAPCHRPLIRMIIQHNGDLCFCCEDTANLFSLGNVFTASLAQLWFSESHTRAVRDLIAGRREPYVLCRNCPQSPTGPPPRGQKIDIAPRRYDGQLPLMPQP